MSLAAPPWSALAVLLPLLASVAACLVPAPRAAWWLAVGGSTAALVCTGALVLSRAPPGLPAHVALLTAFVAAATVWSARDLARPQHALALALLAALLAAVLTDRIGLTWLAMEAALLAGAALLGLTRAQGAASAGWRLLVLGGVGLALALFGSVLLYLAARPVLGAGAAAMRWTALAQVAPTLDGRLLSVAFVLLLAGYGTLAALVPLHTWLAEAEAALPPPLVGLFGGAMTNAALVAILRARAVLAGNSAAMPPGPALMALGLLSLLLAGFALWRQREAPRALAFVTIGQSGVAAFAFGLGGGAASCAGLLHLTLLTLGKSAAVQATGAGTPERRLTLAAGLVALAGLPPFGLFASLFLIANETARRLPWLLAPLGLGLAVAAWALAVRLAALPPADAAERGPAAYLPLLPAWLMLGVVALLGFAMPGPVVAWFAAAASAAR